MIGMNGITQVAVPAGIVTFLLWAFDYGKLLLANVPGFRQSDADHSRHIQLVFFALCFLTVGVYAFMSGAHPADINGWLNWIIGIGQTAVAMAFGGALVYNKISGGASDTTSESTVTSNGLPVNLPVDPAQMGA